MTNNPIKMLISLAIICAGFFSAMGCSSVLQPRDEIADATKMISDGKNQAAIDILRPYIYKNQESFEAHMLAGKAFLLLNPDEENNLYLARHYFSSAEKLAPNEGLRTQAVDAHYEVKLMMGKADQAADTLVESAERLSTLGESDLAANRYLLAARDFNKNENYDDAIESCQEGISNNPKGKIYNALHFTLARAFFLDEEFEDCRNTIGRIDGSDPDRTVFQNAEYQFLATTAPIMNMTGKSKLVRRWQKEFEKGEKQRYINTYYQSLRSLNKMMANASVDEKELVGRYALILARHAKKHSLVTLAKQAYQKSRTAFREAGMEKIAIEVGEELKDLVG